MMSKESRDNLLGHSERERILGEMLGEVKRFPGVYVGHNNLESLALEVASQTNSEPETTQIVAFIGPGGAGKSFLSGMVLEYIQLSCRISKEETGGVLWDDCEELAKARGKITTSDEFPFTQEELNAASLDGEYVIRRGLRGSETESPKRLLRLQFPGVVGVMFDGEVLGRNLGLTALRHLSLKQGVFFNMEKPYKSYVVALYPGPNVIRLAALERSVRHKAKSFEEILAIQNEIDLFNELPLNPANWQDFRRQSARLDRMFGIYEEMKDLADLLKNSGRLQFRDRDQLDWVRKLYEYVTCESLEIPPERLLISYNDPPEGRLNIPLSRRISSSGFSLLFDHVPEASDGVE